MDICKIHRIMTAESSLRNETQKTSHFDNISNKIQDITTTESSLRNESQTSSPFDNTSNKEIRHIGFLKVYKAASSTVQNIFFRFGLKRNLNFVFPRKDQHFHSIDQLMPIKPPEHYDILAIHTIFKEELFTVLPNDSINVAIVREPLDRMVSAAFYYRDVFSDPYLTRIPKEGFIENLVNQSELYDKDYFSRTKNSMAKDFGFPTGLTIRDANKINEILDYLDKRFKFIMVAERFDESLVLLKRLLNWKLSNILYIQSNTHSHTGPRPLSEEAMEKFRKTCFLDYMIYARFKSKFDAIVKQQGAGFQQEVEQFRAILNATSLFCRSKGVESSNSSISIGESIWNSEFLVISRDCELMNKKVWDFILMMIGRQSKLNEFKAE